MGHGNPAKLSELSVGRVVVHSRGPRTTGGGIVKMPPQQPPIGFKADPIYLFNAIHPVEGQFEPVYTATITF